jgi:hypothetical protein
MEELEDEIVEMGKDQFMLFSGIFPISRLSFLCQLTCRNPWRGRIIACISAVEPGMVAEQHIHG